MPDLAPPRSAEQRKRDTLARLEGDVDLWVATGGADGVHLVPLSFTWFEGRVVLATLERSVTVRNLRQQPRLRLALGGTRDVVLVEGSAAMVVLADLTAEVRAAFLERTGWDAAAEPGYVYVDVTPERIMAWREENELAGRTIMRGGTWVA